MSFRNFYSIPIGKFHSWNFLVATGILSLDQNNVSQLFYLFMLFLFFFCCRLIDIVSLKSVCTCDACDYKWYFIFLWCMCRDQINMLHWLNAQNFDWIYRACSNQHFTIVLQHVSFSLPHFVFFDFVYSCCRFHSQCISHMRPFHTKTMHHTNDRMRWATEYVLVFHGVLNNLCVFNCLLWT